MRRPITRLRLASLAAGALAVPLAASALPAAGAQAAAPYTVSTLHFEVHVGPSDATTCDIVGDLYTPAGASPTHRVPAVLTTNGFGGSKDDQAALAGSLAGRGYEVLSYSGLGFGGSGCKITLDDPGWDGKAASQLVSFLGGARGIAFTDAGHTRAAPVLDVVRRDHRDHLGHVSAHDPRVGMIGGSYGGEVQFAAASVDPRIDTIVPLITWNDLSYSLGPNNTDQMTSPTSGQTAGVSTSTPGTLKTNWAAGFSALGVVDGVQGAQDDPSRLVGCPNFAAWVCPALATAGTTGYPDPGTVAHLRHASVTSYLSKIRIPTLLMQGQGDTLFNLNEAAATYRALRAQHTPVKMIWQSWGHSDSTPAPGEWDQGNPDPTTQYETARVYDWFDHYLQGTGVGTGPSFAWFRDWVPYTGIATPAYGTSDRFPVGSPTRFYLSGTTLTRSDQQVRPGSQTFTTPAAGAPTTFEYADVLGSYLNPPLPEEDAPGTFASWTSSPLAGNLDVVGSPRLALQVSAPTAAATQAAGPGGMLVLFVRVQDVAPDGTASDIHSLTAPVRVSDVTRPFTVTLPAFVHRFAAGHRVRLVVAGGSVNYRGGLAATPVTVSTGTAGQVLTLPTTG
ncbi:MAG TPA: CocE/NonD family hydrolase [Marmoricola sp.]|nr:CocE/NonD family hydrolase [Marmoricola sp.]